jgi:putative endonuclease
LPGLTRQSIIKTLGYWVYILASKPGGTLYTGVTNNLVRRAFEHRQGLVRGFTKRYGVKTLVYFEQHDTASVAIQREKNIKHWSREWKIDLIVGLNPTWRDLYDEISL